MSLPILSSRPKPFCCAVQSTFWRSFCHFCSDHFGQGSTELRATPDLTCWILGPASASWAIHGTSIASTQVATGCREGVGREMAQSADFLDHMIRPLRVERVKAALTFFVLSQLNPLSMPPRPGRRRRTSRRAADCACMKQVGRGWEVRVGKFLMSGSMGNCSEAQPARFVLITTARRMPKAKSQPGNADVW